MCFECIQYIPDGSEVGGFNRTYGIFASGNEHRQDDGAGLLVRTQANGTAYSLDDVHLTAARIDEGHAIQRGHVHAFGQAAGIAQHAALFRAQSFELVELQLAFAGGHVAGDEVGA